MLLGLIAGRPWAGVWRVDPRPIDRREARSLRQSRSASDCLFCLVHHAITIFSVCRMSCRVFLATCLYEGSAVVRLQLSIVRSLQGAKKHIRWSCNITIKIYESYISSCSLRVINVLRLWLAGLGRCMVNPCSSCRSRAFRFTNS